MKSTVRNSIWILVALGLAAAALLIGWRFDKDIEQARARVAGGSVLIETRCGPIEYQEAGAGVPLLAVHGSGGGYDQGMAFAGALVSAGHPCDRDVPLWLSAHADACRCVSRCTG